MEKHALPDFTDIAPLSRIHPHLPGNVDRKNIRDFCGDNHRGIGHAAFVRQPGF